MVLEIDKIINEMVERYGDEFEYQIKQRGKDYYNSGKVKSVVKSGNVFRSKVEGRQENDYHISIILDEEEFDFIDYECDCPYEYPCKHIYATMLAIENKEYSSVTLKSEISKKTKTLQELIQEIPSDELKEYLLSEDGKKHVCFEMNHFEKHFSKYLPSQEYAFYYNSLYNVLMLEGCCGNKVSEYLLKTKNLISSIQYKEAFYICKSIIEALNDTEQLNVWNEVVDLFPVLGMNLRIIYRKSDYQLKNEIQQWISYLEENTFYNNLYLEDIVLMIQ